MLHRVGSIEIPTIQGCRLHMRPKVYPVINNCTIAIPLETRRAGPAFFMKMKGITTGNVAAETPCH